MKILSVKMPEELFERMTNARGEVEQSTFIRQAIERKISDAEYNAKRRARRTEQVTPIPKGAK